MSSRRADLWLACGAAALGLALAGCASPPSPTPASAAPEPAPTEPAAVGPDSASLDPTAVRLHDLAGRLLMYYALHRELPAGLAPLQDLPPAVPAEALTDPATGQAFLYDPAGLAVPPYPGRMVLAQATPNAAGRRWTLMLEDATPGRTFIAHVFLVPEVRLFNAPGR